MSRPLQQNERADDLIGFVSDEYYSALVDVAFEFQLAGNSVQARSTATGAVYAQLGEGTYLTTIHKTGFGSKRVELKVPRIKPYQFRLLSDKLSAYVWPKWVRAGEQAEFRVHSAAPYKAELWRYGSSQELISNIGWFGEHAPKATLQFTPDGDYTQTGVRWNTEGYWIPDHQQILVAPDRPGLYFLHVTNESGEFFSAPWIVAPRQPASRIAVLASNITWNAYNNFGGRSNYINPSKLLATPTVNSRQDLPRYTDRTHAIYSADTYAPLSFDRPEPINVVEPGTAITDPIEGRSASHVAPAEWRLLGWLESNNVLYDYYAETQFNAGVLELDRYDVLVMSTHPEYWTAEMYYRLKHWVVESGGRLIYLGGNGIDCEVQMQSESEMQVRNGNLGSQESLVASGFDSRFAIFNESPSELLGVVYTDAGVMTGAPYEVADEDHWIFRDTGLKTGDVFATESVHMRCPGGGSGHETDKIPDPAPANTSLVAKGANPDNGGAEMVVREFAGGGAVFSAGSISVTSSLVVDPGLSQVVLNVFERFLNE